MKKQKSFTLIELMVVIAIIIILAGVAIPSYINLTNKAKVAALKTNMGVLALGLETYRTELGKYPSTAEATGLAQWVAIDDKTGIFYQALVGEGEQQYISGATLNNMPDPFKVSGVILEDGHIYYSSVDGNSWYLVAYTGLVPELYLLRSNTAAEVMPDILTQLPQGADLNVLEDNIYKMVDINDVPENTPVVPPALEALSTFGGFPSGSPLGSFVTHITSPFGIRSDVGTNLDFHLGIDLATGGGSQPVYATLAGIIELGTTVNGGNVIEIWSSYLGSDNLKYYVRVRYVHTASATLGTGTEVKPGALIGYSGNSGTPFEGMGSTYAYHLHYEIRISDTFTNLMDGRKSVKNPLTGGFGLEGLTVSP